MCSIVGRLVLDLKADWEPALFDLGVRISSGTVVRVNLIEQSDGDLILVSRDSFIEDNFQVTVETIVVFPVIGATISIEGNIFHSELFSLSTLWSAEVEGAWRWKSRFEEPLSPV